MEHDYYTSEDFPDDPYLETYLAKMVVEGGLAVCKKCGLYEGSLTTECPQEQSYADYADMVYAGKIDFVDGEWRKQC